MGHEVLTYSDRHAVIHDDDLWAVRHFLLAEATASRRKTEAAFVQTWEWVGNGVYLGLDFDAFLDSDPDRVRSFSELIFHTGQRIETFGEFIPAPYVQQHVNGAGAQFTGALSTARVLTALGKVRELIAADEPAL